MRLPDTGQTPDVLPVTLHAQFGLKPVLVAVHKITMFLDPLSMISALVT